MMTDLGPGDRPRNRRWSPTSEIAHAPPRVVGSLALETQTEYPADRDAELARLVHRQLELLGENADRQGLLRTPERVAKSLAWLTHGYELEPADVIGDAIFEEQHQNMVLVRGIGMCSLCEHHMLPLFGKVHIAYIPNGRIGLGGALVVMSVFRSWLVAVSDSPRNQTPRETWQCLRSR